MPVHQSKRPLDERPLLNARQSAFIGFYLIDFNATQAAIKAGYSAKTATVQASDLLANPKIKVEIEKRKAALAARSEITRDWLVRELAAELSEARKGTEHFDKAGNLRSVTRRPGAVIGLAELLAKMHGWIDDKPQPAQQLVNFVIQR